jgi:hypothetical protein
MKYSCFGVIVAILLSFCPSMGFALSIEKKTFVDEQIVELNKAPRVGSAFIQRISSAGEDCLIYALPKLVLANTAACEAGSNTYTLILLTRVAQIQEPILTKDDVDSLEKIADPKNADQNACLVRIRLLLKQ